MWDGEQEVIIRDVEQDAAVQYIYIRICDLSRDHLKITFIAITEACLPIEEFKTR
jgi:hypothetical protein